jgi:uncharacterized membrane protein
LLAAVVWVGGLAGLVIGLRPALARAVTSPEERDRLWAIIHRRFFLLAACAATILLASGCMMMATNTQFLGLGNYGNTWSKLLVAKHALFLGMVVLLFALRTPRAAKAERDLVDLSLMLGAAVLVVTGLLTASRP